jgi:hypothetical protein
MQSLDPKSITPSTPGFKIQKNVSEGKWRDLRADGMIEVYDDRQRARREAGEMNESRRGTYRAVPVSEPSVG